MIGLFPIHPPVRNKPIDKNKVIDHLCACVTKNSSKEEIIARFTRDLEELPNLMEQYKNVPGADFMINDAKKALKFAQEIIDNFDDYQAALVERGYTGFRSNLLPL